MIGSFHNNRFHSGTCAYCWKLNIKMLISKYVTEYNKRNEIYIQPDQWEPSTAIDRPSRCRLWRHKSLVRAELAARVLTKWIRSNAGVLFFMHGCVAEHLWAGGPSIVCLSVVFVWGVWRGFQQWEWVDGMPLQIDGVRRMEWWSNLNLRVSARAIGFCFWWMGIGEARREHFPMYGVYEVYIYICNIGP